MRSGAAEVIAAPAVCAAILLASVVARADALIELHKDHHPENVLVVRANAGPSCRLDMARAKDRLFDMYWRMDAGSARERLKPTHPRIKAALLKTIEVKSLSADGRTLTLDLAPMRKLLPGLPPGDALVVLTARAACEAYVQLGSLRIHEIWAKGMNVPRRSIREVEFRGTDPSGAPARSIFRGR